VFLLEQGSGPCRALALAIQCLILLDHVGVQQGLQACVPVAGSLGQECSTATPPLTPQSHFIFLWIFFQGFFLF
jgi:hypothetical protein